MEKFASIVLTVVLLATMLSVFAFPVCADGPYAALDGDGTENSPYLIGNADDWGNFIAAVKADSDNGKGIYFKQTGDVGSNDNEVGFGKEVDKFNGVYDGGGNAIWYYGVKAPFKVNLGEIMNIVSRCEKENLSCFGGVCMQKLRHHRPLCKLCRY